MVKPRFGVSSIGNHLADDDEELGFFVRQCRKQIARDVPRLVERGRPGHRGPHPGGASTASEYGLDIVNDLDGGYACTFVKRKLRMRAGQTDRATTVDGSASRGGRRR